MEIKKLFPVKKNCFYFNYAADGPMPVTAQRAVEEAAAERAAFGSVPVQKQKALFENIGIELARLFNAGQEDFAFTRNTSEGILLALSLLDIQAGENYIVAEDAFPATIKMMENHCRGQKRTVRINAGEDTRKQVLDVMDDNTRAIVLDWVHYFTGKVIDLAGLAEIARHNHVFTIIDGIQGAGALELDLPGSGIDFFVSGGHKWLLSPQGTGFIYVSPCVWDRVDRKALGWLGYDWLDFSDFSMDAELRPGAGVFEYGTRSFMTGAGFLEVLKIVNGLGIRRIENHNRQLRHFFLEHASQIGYEVIDNAGAPSTSIIPFRIPGVNAAKLHHHLSGNNVKVSLRNGYIRAAFHFVNDKEEIEKLLELL